MAKRKIFLSIRYIRRVLIHNGAVQISEKSLERFVERIQKEAEEIVQIANSIAKNDKRITVVNEDIESAIVSMGRRNDHNPIKDKFGFSIHSMKKLQEHSGIGRTSDSGLRALKRYLEKLTDLIAYNSVKFAVNSERTRISSNDIDLAFEVYLKR